jgi:hypothetical protein
MKKPSATVKRMRATGATPGEVIDRLSVVGRDRVKLSRELHENGSDMNDLIKMGFDVGLTAAKMVEALGDWPNDFAPVEERRGKPIVGPARVFQIRDDK